MPKPLSIFITAITAFSLFNTCGQMNIADCEESAYTYSTDDVHNLQSFLLNKQTKDNLSGKPYDLNGDDKWDVSDLCLMIRKIVNPTVPKEKLLQIEVNGTTFTATLSDTQAAGELAEKISHKPVTLELSEYGGFEKVGSLPWSLTRTDTHTETSPGDIMLYQGNQMTIFYNSNAWSYTSLGKINDADAETLKAIFGDGDISVTLSPK